MLIVTNVEAVNDIFNAKAPRPIEDLILEIYPEATIDINKRAHAPYDGYICPMTGKAFRAGEYLPFSEPEDNYRVMGEERKFPKAVDLDGVEHSWDGTRAQNIAVWSELFKQTNEHTASHSNHIGDVGDKISFSGVVEMVKGFDGYYGITWIHVLKDMEGNVVVYKGSKRLADKGSEIRVTAKVKSHGEREGIKQTIIERPKLV